MKPHFHTETGRLCLDWMATLGDREGTPIERVGTPADWTRWVAEVAGLRLGREPGEADLKAAIHVRSALIAVVEALLAERRPAAADIAVLNEAADGARPRLALDRSGRALLPDLDPDTRAVLGLIARDAIDLLVHDHFDRLRLCAADDCSVIFVDLSRPGKRRWCSMSRCGNKAKKRAYVQRHARSTPGTD